VLFPEPDTPTIAEIFPYSKTAEKLSKTVLISFLEKGYENVTFLNSI
jgi:hypothetical protein